MKLVKMVCPSCGAKLDVDKDKKEFVCEYCHTTTLLDDEVIRVEHVIKDENIDAKVGVANNFLKGFFGVSILSFIVPFIIVIVIIIIAFIGIGFKNDLKKNDIDKVINNNEVIDETDKVIDNFIDNFEITSFNNDFENYIGVQSAFFVKNMLNDVISANTKGEHVITVVYEQKNVTDVNEIANISKSMVSGKEYTITLEYDEVGFVNKIIID